MSTDDFERAIRIERPDKTTPKTLKNKLSRESQNSTRMNGSENSEMSTNVASRSPVLAIQLQLEQTASGRPITLTRELKVRIVAKRFWAEYKEPTMPQFSVSLFMPALSKIRAMADKLKAMNKHMIVRAGTNGALQLRAKSSTMKISVTFVECEKPVWENVESNSQTSSIR